MQPTKPGGKGVESGERAGWGWGGMQHYRNISETRHSDVAFGFGAGLQKAPTQLQIIGFRIQLLGLRRVQDG